MNLQTKLTCPHCGCQSSFHAFQGTEEILEIAKLASRFGRTWDWVREYLDSFRSAPERPLKPARMKILIEELLDFVEKKGFSYDRQFHAVRPDAIFAAMRNVALLNKVGFKNHNYLKKVAMGINLQMIQKEEDDQQKRELRAMDRDRRDPDGPRKMKEFIDSLPK